MKADETPLLTAEAVRMLRVERLLRRFAHVPLRDMITVTGGSMATVKRDLLCMRTVLDAPITYHAGSGYALAPGWPGVRAALIRQLEAIE